MNAISRLPIGYMTGHFALAEQVLSATPAPDTLLSLLLLSDQLHEADRSHRTAPTANWEHVRHRAGLALMRMLSLDADPDALANWRDRDTDWHPKSFHHAARSIPDMADSDLLTLYIQASETAYLHEGEAMQTRWERVASQARAEILSRVEKAGTLSPSPALWPDADATTNAHSHANPDAFFYEPAEDDAYSLREMLRVAETSFDETMSDERLLDLYLLAEACGGPDTEVFEEIEEKVAELLYARMSRGAPDIDPDHHVPGFDPHEHERALEYVMNGLLSHEDLTTAYIVSFNNIRPRPGDRWLAVNDLCRAQILRRMAGIDRPRGNRNACMRRLLGHAGTVPDRGGADETED